MNDSIDFKLPPAEWSRAAETFGLANLRPAIMPCRQTRDMPIGEGSSVKPGSVGKIPSVVRHIAGRAVIYGMPGWAERRLDEGLMQDSVDRWARMPGAGIAVLTDGVAAVDIDIDDPLRAMDMRSFLIDWLGLLADETITVRWRENSAHLLIPVRLPASYDADKTVLRYDDGGIVEFLAGRRQFIAAGTNKGHPLLWSVYRSDGSDATRGGVRLPGLPPPDSLPQLEQESWQALQRDMEQEFGGVRRVRALTRTAPNDLRLDDPLWQWLCQHPAATRSSRSGAPMLLLACPFGTDGEPDDEHHAADPEGSTTTVVLPPTRDLPPVINCKHATCDGRLQKEFLTRLGWDSSPEKEAAEAYYQKRREDEFMESVKADRQPSAPPIPGPNRTISVDFDDLMDGPLMSGPPPRTLTGKKKGFSDVDAADFLKYTEWTGLLIRRDEYSDMIYVREWANNTGRPAPDRPWRRIESPRDIDHLHIKMQRAMELVAVPRQTVERGVQLCAHLHPRNFMLERLNRLRIRDCAGAIDRLANEIMVGEGAREDRTAVMRYLLTAMIARTYRPGSRADMAPVLYGGQNAGKTTLLRRLAPRPDAYTSLAPTRDDGEAGRRLRGKAIVELEEFAIGHVTVEDLKRFISKTSDEFIDKYEKNQTIQGRTAVMAISTNRMRFLDDPSGARRFPVIHVGDIRLDELTEEMVRKCWSEAMDYVEEHGEADWRGAMRVAGLNEAYDRNANYFSKLARMVAKHPRDEFGRLWVDLDYLGDAIGANTQEGRRENRISVVEGWATRMGAAIDIGPNGRQVLKFDPKRLPEVPPADEGDKADKGDEDNWNVVDMMARR